MIHCSKLAASLLLLGWPLLGHSAAAQGLSPRARAARVEHAPTTGAVVFDGVVLEPDGTPALGAVVVTSAGGQAVTGLDGGYRLAVEVPLEAESVEITALGGDGGNLTSRTSVSLSPAPIVARLEPLVLALDMDCPRWLATEGPLPGVDDTIEAMTVFDDGSGPALYVGGVFANAGGVAANSIAKWDGSSWSALGDGVSGGSPSVHALAVYDDGNGPGIYAGGYFPSAGGAAQVVRWDGSDWSGVGSFDSGFGTPFVSALAVFDDGSGPALYAGGHFTSVGGVPASRIAKWNGSTWSGLGSPVNGTVNTLAVLDLGGGPALYAGGEFTLAGGMTVNRVAQWDGSQWHGLGSGVSGGNGEVLSLAAFDDGNGPALYVGGHFTSAGGQPARRIARWNGSSWSDLGGGIDTPFGGETVQALAVFDDGSGPVLYVGGQFASAGGVTANQIAKWDGASWSMPGTGIGTPGFIPVRALAVYDDGDGPALHVGGLFELAGGVAAKSFARWNGSRWSGTNRSLNGAVQSLTTFDDGSGPAVHAGGWFSAIGAVTARGIAKQEGSSWSAMGNGLSLPYSLTIFDDGSGPALYAGGSSGVTRWDGSGWSQLGHFFGTASALTTFDDGSGPTIYAGGNMVSASSVEINVIRWDGAGWSPLGGGTNDDVTALVVFDDGSGPALYAGGWFTSAGGVAANHIAKWDGASWSALAGGMNGAVQALAVCDLGNGPVLVSGSRGGPHYIAKWDGASWSPLNGGMNSNVLALTVFDDGTGPALYAGGDFTTAGGLAANHVARWNGAGWSALGAGVDGPVLALGGFDDGKTSQLYVGGSFLNSAAGDSFLTRWGCPFPVTQLKKLRKR